MNAIGDLPGAGPGDRLFRPVEHAIMGVYLGLPERIPGYARGIELRPRVPDADADPGWDEAVQGIPPRLGIHGSDDLSLENAVARIVLQPVQKELPHLPPRDSAWGSAYRRRFHHRVPERPSHSHPLFLFEINWAEPHLELWLPERYYLTWVPFYERYVVTASSDSAAATGWCDYAIGHFDHEGTVEECLEEIFVDYWMENHRWGEVLEEGAVAAGTAVCWRERAFPGGSSRS